MDSYSIVILHYLHPNPLGLYYQLLNSVDEEELKATCLFNETVGEYLWSSNIVFVHCKN